MTLTSYCSPKPLLLFAVSLALAGCKDLHPRPARPTAPANAAETAPDYSVYLDLHGDPKLVRRLRALLEVQFDEAGIGAASNAFSAKAEIYADLTRESRRIEIFAGSVKAQFAARNQTTTVTETCPSTSTDEKTDLFDATAKDLAEKIHNQFPKARSVKLDPATAASDAPRFFEEVPAAL